MTVDQLIEKIKQGENDTFELKADIRDPLLLSKLIASFSNNKGGQIVIGIQEPIEIVGSNRSRILDVVEKAKTTLSPIPKLSTNILTVDNKELLVIDVEKSNEIVFSAGSVFQRIGEQIKLMTAEEIKVKLTKISNDSSSLTTLAYAIEKQSQIIDELRIEINNSNSWKSKLIDNFISGLIGAILGFVLTLLLTK